MTSDPLCYKDSTFLSPHRMIGGPSTPVALLVRRELLDNDLVSADFEHPRWFDLPSVSLADATG